VGLFIRSDLPQLYIWNWRTGAQLVVCMQKWLNRSSIALSYLHFSQSLDIFSLRTNHFRFLSNRAYILTCRDSIGSIEIYDFGDEDVAHRASLQLPAVQAGITVLRLNSYSGPLMAHLPTNRPFTSSPDSRLHHFHVQYNDGREGYSFLVQNHTFLSYTSKESSSLAELSWEDWGPNNTRVIKGTLSPSWRR
jgi:hypothetical protein